MNMRLELVTISCVTPTLWNLFMSDTGGSSTYHMLGSGGCDRSEEHSTSCKTISAYPFGTRLSGELGGGSGSHTLSPKATITLPRKVQDRTVYSGALA